MQITLPADSSTPDGIWKPREHQEDLWAYLEGGGKRAMEVWHRRAGKDEICLAWAGVAAHQEVGNYWHCLPEASQARKAIWDAVDPHRGVKRIDSAFPKELRSNTRNSDMQIEFKCGSTWQVVGSDNFDSLVGSTPKGIVFSEWALCNPQAWAYLKPILEENGGWALFITTSRGPNHAQRMYNSAVVDPTWHSSLLTPRETGLVDEVTLARLRKDYITDYGNVLGESLFEQEYLCSFEAAILGAVYGQEMKGAREDGRIGAVPYDPAHPVETWWDIGYRDPCSIWFIQRINGMLHAIDYYENNLSGIDHYVKVINERGYVYSQHLMPHDAASGEAGSGNSLVDQASQLGLKADVQPRQSLTSGINATRNLIRRTRFDSQKCERGLDGLIQYHYEWDMQRHTLSPKPAHGWESHPADAFRTGCQSEGHQEMRAPRRKRKRI